MQYDYNDEYFGVSRVSASVVVKDYAWVSSGLIVLPGATIEEGSVVAVRAVVTKNTAPYGVYAGTQCKRLHNAHGIFPIKLAKIGIFIKRE